MSLLKVSTDFFPWICNPAETSTPIQRTIQLALSLQQASLFGDHIVPRWTGTDPSNLDANKLLDELNVGTSLLRKVIVRLRSGSWLVPAIKLLVNDLTALQQSQISREKVHLLTGVGVLVRDRNLDLLKTVKYIELREVEGCVVVDSGGVLDNNEIEPAASPLASSADTPLATDFLKLCAHLAKILGLENALTDSGSVRLDDTNHIVDLPVVDGETSEDTAQAGVAAGAVRVCAIVDIQHEGIGTLDEDLLVRPLGVAHELDGIDNVFGKLDAVFLETVDLVLNVVLQQVAVTLLVAIG